MLAVSILLLVGQTTEAPRLTYDAPPSCPSEATFRSAVASRAPGVALDAPSPQSLRIEIVTSSAAYAGRLVVEENNETFAPRQVSGADCAEVSSALALIAALVLRAPPEAPPPPRAEALVIERAVVSGPRTPVDRRRPRRWGIAMGLAASAGLLPGVAWSLPVEVAFGGIDDGEHAPVVRAGLRWGRTTTDDGRADFTQLGLSAEVCPYVFSRPRFRLEPCVFAEGGMLSGSSNGLVAPTDRSRPYAALGGRLRGQWFVAPLVFVEAAVHLEGALVRDTFAARPNTTLHRVSGVVGGLQSGVGVIFW